MTPGLIDSTRPPHRLRRMDGMDVSPQSHGPAYLRGPAQREPPARRGVVAWDLGSIEGLLPGRPGRHRPGTVRGPKVQTTGLAVCVTSGHGGRIGLECDGADEIVKGVRTIIKSRADVVKNHGLRQRQLPGPEPGPCELTEAEFSAGVEAAHAMGRKVAIHATGIPPYAGASGPG